MDLQGLDTLGGSTTTGTIPSSVHADTPEKQKMYRACMEFERFFVSKMMEGMNQATKALSAGEDDASSGDSDSSQASGAATSNAGTSAYGDMVQDQMTQAVLDGGGVGIAGVLYGQMVGTLDAKMPSETTTPAAGGSTTTTTAAAASAAYSATPAASTGGAA